MNITLQQFLGSLALDWELAIDWPPDVFGLMAATLQKTGAYLDLAERWPPEGVALIDWCGTIKSLGHEWRESYGRAVPTQVKNRWGYVVKSGKTELARLSEDKELMRTILELTAIADEACVGVGFSEGSDKFQDRVSSLLYPRVKSEHWECSLGSRLDSKQITVLPKIHTPRSGITIRAISHHLALCHAGEITPRWIYSPTTLKTAITTKLDLLLVPWPLSLSPDCFVPVVGAEHIKFELPKDFGFFRYDSCEPFPQEAFDHILRAAKRMTRTVHGVILPELTLPLANVDAVWQQINRVLGNESFLISGVAQGHINSAICMLPPADTTLEPTKIFQEKHHRWLLTASQIRQYGLTRTLDPRISWWEHARMAPRKLLFVAINPSLTITFLICEDLARQDPLGEVIRSVGPHLIIALLMDGPQLSSRWPARYATVLADDPGCSVLTLTSLGMTRLSRPLGRPECRIVALWKDAKNGPFEIELPPDADALILRLAKEEDVEWTIDGRKDDKSSVNWILEAVHPISSRRMNG